MVFASLLTKKPTSVVGIDISATSIKAIELTKVADKYKLLGYGFAAVPANVIVENEVKNIEILGKVIRQAIAIAGVKSKSAIIAVSGSSVITKTIQLGADLTENEIFSQITLESDRYIPYPIEDVNLDFHVLGPNAGSNTLVDVVLAASRRENVDTRVEALIGAGLEPYVVDIEAYAIERAFGVVLDGLVPDISGKNKTYAIIDIGANISTLSVLHHRETVYTREQIFGGRALLDEVKRRYGVDWDLYAEDGFKAQSLPAAYAVDVLEPFKQSIVQQVSRALQFFFSASDFDSIDGVYLAGGTARIEGVADLVAQKLGLPVKVANPFEGMDISDLVNKDRLYRDAPALMLGCGLALRGLCE